MYATLCCSVLHCGVAVCCRDFITSDEAQHDVRHTMLQCVAVCCSVLQRVAVCCVCCSVLRVLQAFHQAWLRSIPCWFKRDVYAKSMCVQNKCARPKEVCTIKMRVQSDALLFVGFERDKWAKEIGVQNRCVYKKDECTVQKFKRDAWFPLDSKEMCVQKTWMCKTDGRTKEMLYSLLMHTKCAQNRCVCTRDVCVQNRWVLSTKDSLYFLLIPTRCVCTKDWCARSMCVQNRWMCNKNAHASTKEALYTLLIQKRCVCKKDGSAKKYGCAKEMDLQKKMGVRKRRSISYWFNFWYNVVLPVFYQMSTTFKWALYSIKSATYSTERALCSIKRALYSIERATYSIKRAIYSITRALYPV